ncbi:ATPase domain-containing protein [Paludibacter jiangxiensis]|uniref:KaiC protein n=1 Tax=Paludibacter jiangxiensis TaxID=681398 RepID=A0A161LVR6_9BACT|nr:ATPase domain-containing protein [Paludibacter jiangxiensis]GAT63399.1 KaiC protein [Paludibacter jiangxiensis]
MESVNKYNYDLEELRMSYQNYLENPYKRGLECGIKEFDSIVRLAPASFAIWTATAGAGKTTFINYYSYLMAKKYNWKTLFISFETPIYSHIKDFLQMKTGKNCDGQSIEDFQSNETLFENLIFVKADSISTIDQISRCIKYYVDNYQINSVVLDPFNYIDVEGNMDTNSIGRALRRLAKIPKRYNILLNLVAHQRKLQKDEPSGENILGSVHFKNMADFIIVLKRNLEGNSVLITADKIRDNIDKGKMGETVELFMNTSNKHFTSTKPVVQNNDPDALARKLLTLAKKKREKEQQGRVA